MGVGVVVGVEVGLGVGDAVGVSVGIGETVGTRGVFARVESASGMTVGIGATTPVGVASGDDVGFVEHATTKRLTSSDTTTRRSKGHLPPIKGSVPDTTAGVSPCSSA